jgi:hypothetical protein
MPADVVYCLVGLMGNVCMYEAQLELLHASCFCKPCWHGYEAGT